MKTSAEGIQLIKKFEGCVLKAYKAVDTEVYWTIGYGHYGPDVHQGDVITQQRATELLQQDLDKFEKAVEHAGNWNQSQFDALVSFTYNCGPGNLAKLVYGRNTAQIADAMLLYVKAGGLTLQGLVRRRKAERELFMKDVDTVETVSKPPVGVPAPKPTKKKKVDKSVDTVEKKTTRKKKMISPVDEK